MSGADGINFRRAAIRRKSTPGLGPVPYGAAPTLPAGAPRGEPARSSPAGNDGFGLSAGEGWGRSGNIAAWDERMAFFKSCQPPGCGRRETQHRARPAPGPQPLPCGRSAIHSDREAVGRGGLCVPSALMSKEAIITSALLGVS